MGGDGSFVRRKWGRGWEGTEHLYEGNGVGDGMFLIVCTKETEQGMGGNGAFVRRKWSGGWEVTEHLYEGNGAEDGRCWGRRWLNVDRLYEGIGAGMGGDGLFVRRNRSGGWEVTEHLYGGSGAEDGRRRSGCTVPPEKSL